MILPELKLAGMAELLQLFPGINTTLQFEMIESISKFYGAIVLSSVTLHLPVTMESLIDYLEAFKSHFGYFETQI